MVTTTAATAATLEAVTLPIFSPSDDPGPSFTGLLSKLHLDPGYAVNEAQHRLSSELRAGDLDISHGTTVVASRFDGGVVIAGDRRATSGNLISHRTMQKVFPADRWSGVAIAGAAGPAIEMVKLFQLQLEHYEKVEGHSLSLEGKANQLSQMVRQHLPAAMQGMVVVPLFAGFDRLRERGRLFAYDVTGGRYEEEDYVASGSGSLHAKTVIKLGRAGSLDRDTTVDLLIRSLFMAADDDSATGGPDSMRGIYPIVATITADGYQNVEEREIADRFASIIREYVDDDGTNPDITTGGASV